MYMDKKEKKKKNHIKHNRAIISYEYIRKT